jgi:cysteinyl-tRNA synthetase
MAIHFFNTYSRELEEFQPLDPAGREVKLYTCGPTVYSHAHIGNFRAYLFEDLLQRHLELREYKVRRVMNITDVDDKTIRGSREAGVPLAEFTAPFKKAFFDDLEALRIKRPDFFPEATDPREIEKMIEMIKTLVERGLAYQAEDKSVYFRINKFPDYGKLAHIDLAELRSTGRVKSDEYEKENIGDFALWKAWDEEDGPVKWASPWGPGRPGWHIECSAMATQLLGEQLDIHCGGVDNIFPHHEAEIAQTEGCTGKKFVCYWLHCAHLMVDGQKMAKSLGNFYTLRDVLAKGYKEREIRYALLRVHYRKPLNFTWEGVEEARVALGRIDDWVRRLKEKAGEEEEENVQRPTPNVQRPMTEGFGFEEALDDDLNISGALGVLFEAIRKTNRTLDLGEMKPSEAGSWLEWWARIDGVLFISGEETAMPAEIAALGEARVQARLAKDWRKSDELRDELAARGWEARDTKEGQKITRRGGV